MVFFSSMFAFSAWKQTEMFEMLHAERPDTVTIPIRLQEDQEAGWAGCRVDTVDGHWPLNTKDETQKQSKEYADHLQQKNIEW